MTDPQSPYSLPDDGTSAPYTPPPWQPQQWTPQSPSGSPVSGSPTSGSPTSGLPVSGSPGVAAPGPYPPALPASPTSGGYASQPSQGYPPVSGQPGGYPPGAGTGYPGTEQAGTGYSGAGYPAVLPSGATPAGYPPTEPIIAQIGEIQVTSTSIRTPAGVFALQGSQWTVTDQWISEEKIPTWAIVLAIVLFFCLTVFSLLFLLAKETVHRAIVQVHVVSGNYQYVARIPAADQAQVHHIYQQVNYVRSLAAAE